METNDKVVYRLIQEFKKRKENEEGTLKIICTELKSQRLKLSKTLKYVAYNICSISYASKLENSLINSNRYIISEYGKKVGLDDSKIQVLYDLKIIILKCIDAYFDHDYNSIKKYYTESLGFVNYRSKIIRLIHYISIRKMDEAYKYIVELMKLSGSFTDFDLNVFSLFYSIYLFYAGTFNDSLELIEVIDSLSISEKFGLLKETYSFYIHIALNSNSITEKYNNAKEHLINSFYFDRIDELTYFLCVSFIRKNDRYHFSKYFKNVKNESYKEALNILFDFIYDFHFDYRKYKKTSIIFADAILELSKDPEFAKSYLVNNNVYYIDYNYHILKYLIYSRIDGSNLLPLIKELVDYGTTVEDPIYKFFIFREAVKYFGKESKYKFIHDIYLKFWGVL